MSTRRILGILEDGTNPDLSLPASAATTMLISIGESVAVDLTVAARSGVQVILVGSALAFYVKKHPEDAVPLITKPGVLQPALGPNRALFSFVPNDTKLVLPGVYVWEVWHTDAGGSPSVIVPLSSFRVLPVATPVP
jgi:hypothetical protein